ncbi:hypothetical protein [Ralstonia solanacearum]|uniref:hypothetical protein n=1 Tax=Ralstonia solanacearum TaxID=305 RepID=UPI0013014EB6|nr:hypothetical protein [Ralstonia solanacearum]
MAFLFAPLFPSIFMLFALQLTDPKIAVFVLLFSFSFSYLPCLLLGIPLVRFLEGRNALNVINMTLSGVLAGVLVFYGFGFAISVVLGSTKSIVPTLGELVSGALLGFSVALPFSLISGFPLWREKK